MHKRPRLVLAIKGPLGIELRLEIEPPPFAQRR
jgi:hypothetical protein